MLGAGRLQVCLAFTLGEYHISKDQERGEQDKVEYSGGQERGAQWEVRLGGETGGARQKFK